MVSGHRGLQGAQPVSGSGQVCPESRLDDGDGLLLPRVSLGLDSGARDAGLGRVLGRSDGGREPSEIPAPSRVVRAVTPDPQRNLIQEVPLVINYLITIFLTKVNS